MILDYAVPETRSLYIPPATFIGQHISAVLPPHVCTPALEALRAAFVTGIAAPAGDASALRSALVIEDSGIASGSLVVSGAIRLSRDP